MVSSNTFRLYVHLKYIAESYQTAKSVKFHSCRCSSFGTLERPPASVAGRGARIARDSGVAADENTT